MLARMENGYFSRALELLENEELLGNRQLVLDYFRYAYTRNTDKISDLVDQMAALGRERLKGLLGLMLSWIRDLMLYRVTGNQELLINIDQVQSVQRFCEHVPDADIQSMVSQVEEAIELIGRNVHSPLTLVVLADGLHRAMKGEQRDRLYIPLHESGATGR
jgi:DNA polymerase-3 subunit delta'